MRVPDRLNVGYRGGDQLLISVMWFAIAWSLWMRMDPDPQHITPIEHLGIPIRTLVWLIPAVVVPTLVLWKPHIADRYGFTLLVVPPALRALSYIFAVPAGLLTHNVVGYSGAWLDALVWCAVTMFIIRQSSRPEGVIPPSWEQARARRKRDSR